MLENVTVFCHSSIMLSNDNVIYVDPFKIKKNYNNADIVLITHNHYDHYSEKDIKKVKKDDTIIVVPKDLAEKTLKLGFDSNKIVKVEPNNEYFVKNIKINAIPAYKSE